MLYVFQKLAEAIRYNEQLETLNLESNVITQKGIEVCIRSNYELGVTLHFPV